MQDTFNTKNIGISILLKIKETKAKKKIYKKMNVYISKFLWLWIYYYGINKYPSKSKRRREPWWGFLLIRFNFDKEVSIFLQMYFFVIGFSKIGNGI